ncbi:fructose-bisphosphatase class II [Plantibacter sp. CFBP 8798]|uniref:fructose-bisphosphatase class II n=1 Tax=Plantibacter sp. CFBP 8798 TaxID=2775268 RepID=UPI0017875B0B|nr:fructose-bisphosphatase class II [Plantibacter sp. CFBP 8798]MBD8466906.1 fructose-bisphosphatase class II [Plantibacter sp. CFBP 8798]
MIERTPDTDLLDGFLDATRAAAAAVAGLVGGGDGMRIDGVAVDALRRALESLPVDGRVVVGEGEKDRAPMLFVGERFGTGAGPAIDLAVDPVDGTKLAASGKPDSVAVIAIAPRGAMFDIGPAYYLEKLVAAGGGRELSLADPIAVTLDRLAARLGRPVEQLRVAVQDRPRNAATAQAVTAAGAELVSFMDGDVALSLRAAAADGDLDLLLGVGGAPEGILTAAAVRALGGWMTARFAPQSPEERARLVEAGTDLDREVPLDELCRDDAWLLLSAVTSTALAAGAELAGVQVEADGGVMVESVVVGPGSPLTRSRKRLDRDAPSGLPSPVR